MSTSLMPVALRCDAGPLVGAGHMVRSLALAEGFRRVGATPCMLTPMLPAAWREMVRSRGIELVEAPLEDGDPGLEQMASIFEGGDSAGGSGGGGIAVLDSYAIDVEAVAKTWAVAGFVAVIRDGDPALGADAVVDPNLGAQAESYPDVACALLGSRYALLREEFRQLERKPEGSGDPRVLITLGGSSTEQVLPAVLEGLGRTGRPLNIRIVGSPWDREQTLPSMRSGTMQWLPPQLTLAEELAAADLALLAAGGVRFEAAAAGCPMILGILAENQVADAEAFNRIGAARLVGWWRDADPDVVGDAVQTLLDKKEQTSQMVKKAREIVDGRGAERAARELLAAAESRTGR